MGKPKYGNDTKIGRFRPTKHKNGHKKSES